MKYKKNKYNTFFFKEYAGIAEKNTYSAYIPNDGKGLWVLVVDSEIEENFAKIGVETIVENYIQNNTFSMENMNELLNEANKKIIESKISKGKDYNSEFSILLVMTEKTEMNVGNIGQTKFKLFRENEVFEEVSGNKIKNIELKKNDYALIGSPMFWKTINENEVLDTLIRIESKKILENSLSEKIERTEKLKNMSIPFLSIFVENLEEKEPEIVITEIKDKRINPLKYLLLLLIPLLLFVALGKTFQNNGFVKKAKEHTTISEEKFNNKKFKESIDELDTAISYYNKINPKNKKIETVISELESKKELAKIEEEKLLNAVNNIKVDLSSVETVSQTTLVDEKVEEKVEEIEKIEETIQEPKKKSIKKTTKNIGTKKAVSNNKNNRMTLEEEIQKNWRTLGRDKNGNKKPSTAKSNNEINSNKINNTNNSNNSNNQSKTNNNNNKNRKGK